MKTHTIEEIEKAFREMGLTEATWGRKTAPEAQSPSAPQIFIRIETTTTPIERKTNADLA